MKPKALMPKDLQRISQYLLMGLRSGKDMISILKWAATHDSSAMTREYLNYLTLEIRFDNQLEVFEKNKRESLNLFQKLFFEILLQSQRGSSHVSGLIEVFIEILRRVQRLQKQAQSLLFVPRFQAIVGLSVALLFALVLPWVWPDLFPSFLLVGRADLFCTGMGGALLGVWVLRMMCQRPQRHFEDLLQTTFFFQFMTIFVQSGSDFMTSWSRSVSAIPFRADLKKALSPQAATVQTVHDFLTEKREVVPSKWKDLMTGLLWATSTGQGLSNYLRASANAQADEISFEWEDEIRKLTALSVLPLSFIVFPAAMFLLVGPRFLELMSL